MKYQNVGVNPIRRPDGKWALPGDKFDGQYDKKLERFFVKTGALRVANAERRVALPGPTSPPPPREDK